MIITIPLMIFIMNPYFIISFIFIYPDEYAIALGGVPTGIMKAQLAPKVNGMQSCKTEYPDS